VTLARLGHSGALRHYDRAEVRRPVPTATTPDTMVALTNPIFLD
jgi:hypothetical protein